MGPGLAEISKEEDSWVKKDSGVLLDSLMWRYSDLRARSIRMYVSNPVEAVGLV